MRVCGLVKGNLVPAMGVPATKRNLVSGGGQLQLTSMYIPQVSP